MKSRLYYTCFLLSIFFAISCEQEEFSLIDEELKPYFERFQEEAVSRGFDLDFSELEGKIEELEGVGGQCVHNTELPDLVRIDFVFWGQANELDKEFIVFHELGHCVLNRGHLDTRNDDGTCKSIMHSGSSGCLNQYSSDTREDYLHELFFR